MIATNEGYARLEYFSRTAAADSRRKEFDIKNHSLIYTDQKPDFLFIGDSITHYWELNAYFNLPGQLIVNRGIGGDTTEYLKRRFYADALQLKPRYCIMGIGINDSIELEGDYWRRLEPTPYEEVLTAAQRNISDIIRQTESTDTTLILTSLLPIHIPVSLNEAVRKRYIKEMNAWLAATARRKKLIYVNYYLTTTFPGTDKLLGGITYDGLHPNARGYEIMAAVLKNTLHQYKDQSVISHREKYQEESTMIFDSIRNKENYREYETLYTVLCYLEGLHRGELPQPNTVIAEHKIFCNPVSFTSKPEEACIYEAHKKYIDLHYIVSGKERIATADVRSLDETVPYDADKDIGFYKGHASGHSLLKPGDFMVCYPSDAHMVAMMEDKPEKIEKVVVKIRVQ